MIWRPVTWCEVTDLSSPSAESKSKPRKKSARSRQQTDLYVLFGSEDGDMFLRNVRWLLPNYTELQRKRSYSVWNSVLWGVTPSSLVDIYKRFVATFYLHIQISQLAGRVNFCWPSPAHSWLGSEAREANGHTYLLQDTNHDKYIPDYTASHPRRQWSL
jgi:hypothetical protein